MKTTVIIPSRYGSSRFPGKPLTKIMGKPLIQHVVEHAKGSLLVSNVIVATDDKRILDLVNEFGGEVYLTSSEYKTGTDRIADISKKIDSDYYINLQGDEILLSPLMLDELIKPFLENKDLEIGTLKSEINNKEDLLNKDIVKVVTDKDGFALYFSRAPIPFMRDGNINEFPSKTYYRHFGIYIYRKDILQKFSNLPSSCLEDIEKLEQLRVIENGYRIKVIETRYDSLRIDRPEDLEFAINLLNKCKFDNK